MRTSTCVHGDGSLKYVQGGGYYCEKCFPAFCGPTNEEGLKARIAELEAEKARALDRLDEMYLARTELEKKQITLLSNYGRLESALRGAEKALEIVTSADGDFERTQFELCGCEEVQAWMGLCKRRKRLAREALTAIRAALHGEGK